MSALAGPGLTELPGGTMKSGVQVAPVAMATVSKCILMILGILQAHGTTCLARTFLTYLLSVRETGVRHKQ